MEFKIILALALQTCFWIPVLNKATASKHNDVIKIRLHKMMSKIQSLQKELDRQEIEHVRELQELEIKSAAEISLLVSRYEHKITKQQLQHQLNKSPTPYDNNDDERIGAISELGCELDILHLSCPATKTIYVDRAYYGQYSDLCAEGCCVPHPVDDCRESMEQSTPQDWLAIKILCDGQGTCDVENQGGLVLSCLEPYSANYMLIYYSCIPEEPPSNAPVGFTAYANITRAYDSGNIAIYDNTVTNVGRFFNPSISLFTCPFDAQFVFSLTVGNDHGNNMQADIYHGNNSLVTAKADQDLNNQGTTMVLVECNRGDEVWVKCTQDNNEMFGSEELRYSSFSGMLASL